MSNPSRGEVIIVRAKCVNDTMSHVNYTRNVIIIIPDELARVLSTFITFIEFVEHPYEFSLIARSYYLDKLGSHR